MKRLANLIIFCALLGVSLNAGAQTAGNKAGVQGYKQWTISLEAAYGTQAVRFDNTVSRRYFLKSAWGVASWLDVFILGGVTQMELKSGLEDIQSFKSKFNFSYGLGLKASAPLFNGVNYTAGVQGLRMPFKGSFNQALIIGDQQVVRESKMNFDWREFRAHAGLVFPVKYVRFYLAGAGWYLWTKEKMTLTNVSTHPVTESGEFTSELWTGAIFGIEIALPERYALTIEGLFYNASYYQITVGIAQTGGPGW